MPMGDLVLLSKAADRLEAVERLQTIQDRSISSGFAKEQAIDQHIQFLNERASGENDRRPQRGAPLNLSALRDAGFSIKLGKPGAEK